MRYIVLILSTLLSLCLAGCNDAPDKTSVPEIEKVSLENMPIEEIECIKTGDYILQVPEQTIETETKGEIVDYIVCNDSAYVLVSYDFYYQYFYNQIALYEVDLKDGTMTLVVSDLYDEGVLAGLLKYDGEILWYEVDEAGVWYECNVENGVTQKEIVEDPRHLSDKDDSQEWSSDIPEEYLTGKTRLLGESDGYIVWEQWMDETYLYKNAYINAFDKKTGEVKQLCKDDFGIVHTPVFLDDVVVFLTIHDIKSYEDDKDLFGNMYVVDISTMEYKRITENYGREDSLDTKFYDEPRIYDNYIYFISTVKTGGDYEYEYLYYLDLNED